MVSLSTKDDRIEIVKHIFWRSKNDLLWRSLHLPPPSHATVALHLSLSFYRLYLHLPRRRVQSECARPAEPGAELTSTSSPQTPPPAITQRGYTNAKTFTII